MKQRITVDELNKLSNAQKEQLREWWMSIDRQIGDVVHEQDGILTLNFYDFDSILGYRLNHINEALPLLSIGQLIEVLNSAHHNLAEKEIRKYYDIPRSERNELCDALWDSVKKVLE